MALTKIITNGITDDAVTEAKLANAINTAVAANTAKDLTALSAANLTSGTIPDARFPATLPAASAANLTSVPAANITGTLPAISATNLTNVPAANITGTLPAISGANLTNLPASGKVTNLVGNGSMTVAQRSAGPNEAQGYGTVDRWKVTYGGQDQDPSQAQVDITSGTTPYTLGFRKAYKVINGNQTSGAGSGDYIRMHTHIEGQDVASSGWNYLSASSYITLSFWVKSSVAQNFYGFLRATDGTIYQYPFETGSLSANTWTKVTKTIPGNSNLTFTNDHTSSLDIWIHQFAGTDQTDSGVTLNAWGAYNGSAKMPDNTSTWYTTNDATFELTGVLLETGNSASNYPHESFGENLRKCQRYFHTLGLNSSGIGHSNTYYWFNTINQSSPQYRRCRIDFPVTMRTAPTVSSSTGNNNGVGGTPSGTQHGDRSHITFHWDAPSSGALVELTGADFSADL